MKKITTLIDESGILTNLKDTVVIVPAVDGEKVRGNKYSLEPAQTPIQSENLKSLYLVSNKYQDLKMDLSSD